MGNSIKIGSIVIRCYQFEEMIKFWQHALYYSPKYPPSDSWVILMDPTGQGPNISLDRTSTKREGKRSWFHFDLYAQDRDAEVLRLINIGARKYDWRYPENADYVVLEDPDGNLFCVVQV